MKRACSLKLIMDENLTCEFPAECICSGRHPFKFTKNYFEMKKVGIVLSIVFITALLITSCKTTEKCPAYSQDVKVENTVRT